MSVGHDNMEHTILIAKKSGYPFLSHNSCFKVVTTDPKL